MRNRMLIPSIASKDGWKKYFKTDILRVLGYCQRVLGLYNEICANNSSSMIKKMVIGVIGRDTIGHWRDIQSLYKKFYGITCIKCEEAVKQIAAGVPFENVVNGTSLSISSRWELIEDIKTLLLILINIVNKTMDPEEIDVEDISGNDIDVKRLSSNPLEIFRFIKGFYSTSLSLLPLYNDYTFFLHISRSIHTDLLYKYFPKLDINALGLYNINYEKIKLCKDDEYTILIPSKDSIANYIYMYIETVYRIVKRSLKIKISSIFDLVDEKLKYVSTMIHEAKNVETEFNPSASQKLINIIRRNSITRKLKLGYVYSTSTILFNIDKDNVLIGSSVLKCEDFFNSLSPYILTGLAHLEDLQSGKGKRVVKAKLHIYYSVNNKEKESL
ncbi:MAG: hypothetical protein QXL96_01095 [Ignisphaera sp.]